MVSRPVSRRSLPPAILLAAALLLPTAGRAQTASPPSPAGTRDAAFAERRAWGLQVRTLRASERAELDSLEDVIRQLPPGAEQVRAQRVLESAKRAWRRRALEAQWQRAQAHGQAAHAARLRERIVALDRREAERAVEGRKGGAR